jgi:hypothetical protein
MARRIARPTVVLPEPDSPTSPTVSPRRMSKLTSVHRAQHPRRLPNSPRARSNPPPARAPRSASRSCALVLPRPWHAGGSARHASRRPAPYRQAPCGRTGPAPPRRSGDGTGSPPAARRGWGCRPAPATAAPSRSSGGSPPAAPGIGMGGGLQHLAHRTRLDDGAQIHHRDVLRDLGDHAKVVGDEDHRSSQSRAAGRASGPAPAPGWSRPAPWSARRRSAGAGRPPAPARSSPAAACPPTVRAHTGRCAFPGLDRPTLASISIASSRALRPDRRLVQADRLHHLVADGVDRAEAGHRLLKDHADLAAADLAEPARPGQRLDRHLARPGG